MDRWRINLSALGAGQITLENSGLILSRLAANGSIVLYQLLYSGAVSVGEVVTMSVLTAEYGLSSKTIQVSDARQYIYFNGSTPENGYMAFGIVNGTPEFDLGTAQAENTGPVLTVRAAKLERGENQTLAYQGDDGLWQLLPQPDLDYRTQLLKCQAYYQLYSSAELRPAKAVDCRPVMRIDPTPGTIQIGETTYYYNSAEL